MMTERQIDLACLAGLPGATPHRLRRLLAHESAKAAWSRVLGRRVGSDVAPAKVLAGWYRAAGSVDRLQLGSTLSTLAIEVTCLHDREHPPRLVADLDPAPILFRVGRSPAVDSPRVAIIGTRRCSPVGREIAFELGRGLAEAGVVVVSGLALGIDGAAHQGALSVDGAPAIGVVGSGPDIVYPRRHLDLWNQLAARGALFTEAPIGAVPEPWRFPARNRLLAAMSDLVVVVESRAAGGSLLTVEQAIRRDIQVMAVPGSLRNKAAEGTNQLLADGCQPVRDTDDVLVALDLCEATVAARRTSAAELATEPELDFGAEPVAQVIDCVDDGPTTLEQIVDRCSKSLPEILSELDSMIERGTILRDGARFIRAERG